MIYSKMRTLILGLGVMTTIVTFYSCSKNGGSTTPIANTDSTVILTVNQNKPGFAIPATFQGLSYETNILPNSPTFLNPYNTNLINLIGNIGNGVLRIGGNSSDDVIWVNSSSSSQLNTISQSQINTLSAFSKQIKWKVLFGLNMGEYDTDAAATEASYVYNTLGSNLLAVQFGNEPDGYHSWNLKRATNYGYPNYKTEWENYYNAVIALSPNIPIAGPDVAYQSNWVKSFAADEKGKFQFVDGHYYQNGPATNTQLTVDSLFTPMPPYPGYFTIINTAAVAAKTPWRISECNSINGGGATGISNVFGAALWALDFMWTVAENGGSGVNFHGGTGGAYSPFNISSGNTVPQPIYYAFLAFKNGAYGDTIIPATLNTTKYKCSAYSAKKNGVTTITLINKSETQGINYKVQLTNTASIAHVARLKASSMMATSGVTFCGSSVNGDGTYQSGNTEDYTIGGLNTFTVNIPAASAAVVTLQ